MLNDSEDLPFDGVSDYYQSWPASDVVQWQGEAPAELAKKVDEGGCWSGGKSSFMLSLYQKAGH